MFTGTINDDSEIGIEVSYRIFLSMTNHAPVLLFPMLVDFYGLSYHSQMIYF